MMATKATSPMAGWLRDVLVLSTCMKLLLVPAYHSTDMEVHRHWLALTKSTPLSRWYFDVTSPWTLDYPPFFALFERIMAEVIAVLDPRITHLHHGLDYAAPRAKFILRVSVILTELVLVAALWALATPHSTQSSKDSGSRETYQEQDDEAHAKAEQAISPLVASAILLHPALLIVDHIHFQYNGFLTGVLLWSVWAAREHRPLLSAFLFSSLLMLKHIYLYLAPAYFVFLLRTYVIPARTTSDKTSESGPASRLFTLGTITLMPPLIAVMPLLASGLTTSAPAGPFGILKQMLARLFPFQRGLNHAYWAANFWALYSFMDRALLASGVLSSSTAAEEARISSSRGLVGDTAFGVLPDISASHCFILTAAPLLVLCSRLWTRPTYLNFLTVLVSSGLTSFIFGYHVHEKAVLLPLLPLTLLAPINYHYARLTLLLSMAGILALFPLLYGAKETPLKVLYTTVWGFLVFGSIRRQVYRPVPSNFMAVAHVLENTYLMGFIGVQLYVSVLHSAFFTRERSPSVQERQQLLAGATDAGAAVVDFVTSALLANGSPGLMSSSSKDTLAPNSTANAMRSMSVPASETSYRDASSKPSQSAAGLGATVETHTLYEFLPLMLISVYSALGILWVWARLGWILLTQSSSTHRMSNTMTAPARGQHVPPDGKAMQ